MLYTIVICTSKFTCRFLGSAPMLFSTQTKPHGYSTIIKQRSHVACTIILQCKRMTKE